jgi:hypothetical protein
MKFIKLYSLLCERRNDYNKVQEISNYINEQITTLSNELNRLLKLVLSYSPTKTTQDQRVDIIYELRNFFNYPPFVFLMKKDETCAEFDPKYKRIIVYDNNLANAFDLLKKYTTQYLYRTDKVDKYNIKKIGGLKNIKQILNDKYQQFIELINKKEIQSALFHELIHRKDDYEMKTSNLLKQSYSRGQRQEDMKYKLKQFYIKKIKTGELSKEQAQEEFNKRLSYSINKEYFNNTGEINAFTLQVFHELSQQPNINTFEDFINQLKTRLATNLRFFTQRNKKQLFKRAYQYFQKYKK